MCTIAVCDYSMKHFSYVCILCPPTTPTTPTTLPTGVVCWLEVLPHDCGCCSWILLCGTVWPCVVWVGRQVNPSRWSCTIKMPLQWSQQLHCSLPICSLVRKGVSLWITIASPWCHSDLKCPFCSVLVHGVWSCVTSPCPPIYCAYMCVGPYPNHLLLFLPHDPFLASPLMHARIIQCPSLSAVSLVCTGT